MTPDIIAIMGVGVAIVAIVLTAMHRMESRLNNRIETLESNTKKGIADSEARLRSVIREFESRLKSEILASENRLRSVIRASIRCHSE